VGGEDTSVGRSSAQTRYYRLIADAVAGLEHNSAEARRVLYERARKVFRGDDRSSLRIQLKFASVAARLNDSVGYGSTAVLERIEERREMRSSRRQESSPAK
jgi:hypothetical protein